MKQTEVMAMEIWLFGKGLQLILNRSLQRWVEQIMMERHKKVAMQACQMKQTEVRAVEMWVFGNGLFLCSSDRKGANFTCLFVPLHVYGGRQRIFLKGCHLRFKNFVTLENPNKAC